MQTISCDVQRSLLNKKTVSKYGVHFNQHLTWNHHLNSTIKLVHGTLKAPRRFSRFTPFHVRKTLAEAYILSKINYANTTYAQIPNYVVQRLQKIYNITAGYVFHRNATTADVVKLGWLPERTILTSARSN